MITVMAMIVLAVGVYAQRLIGMVAVDASAGPSRWHAVLDIIPVAIIAAVIALQAATSAGSLELDARLIGVAAAGVCVWRRLPLAVAVVVAAAVTALIRLAT